MVVLDQRAVLDVAKALLVVDEAAHAEAVADRHGQHDDAADAGQDYLRANTGASKAFVITLPNAATIGFNAVIGGMSEDIPLEDAVGFSISCKIDGVKTYSA